MFAHVVFATGYKADVLNVAYLKSLADDLEVDDLLHRGWNICDCGRANAQYPPPAVDPEGAALIGLPDGLSTYQVPPKLAMP
jgi:hypothetical protein